MSKARDLAGLFNLNPTSGTTAQRPATADVGDIYYNGTTGKTEIYTATGWKEMASGIPFGNTAGRPTAVTGQPYFNGETARLEMYTATGWQNIVQEVPGVASITGTYSEATNSGTITIAGTNFVSGAIASAIGTNGVEVLASSTTYNSLVQISAIFTGLSNANEPYDIKVTNPSNLFGLIPDALYINASPVWQTASGSLGTFAEQVSMSVSATATDSDSTITYALASGSTLPSGVTLNSSTGLISGTLPNISTDTTYTFTINATDGLNVIPRTFNIISIATVEVEYLVIAGGGSGGSPGGGGGAGGYRYGTGLGLLRSSNYLITVGNGANAVTNAQGNKGNNSVFGTISATGGGIGGNSSGAGPGGSGGGGSRDGAAAAGIGNQGNYTPVEGYAGGTTSPMPYGGGGGGGGAGGVGSPGLGGSLPTEKGGAGGVGLSSSITGSSIFRGGGGGGGAEQPGSSGAGAGGNGGGGAGGLYQATATSGASNTGGGGGGAGYPGTTSGAGGSGVVIIAYPDTFAAITTIPGTLTYDQPTRAGYRVYRFTAGSGTVMF